MADLSSDELIKFLCKEEIEKYLNAKTKSLQDELKASSKYKEMYKNLVESLEARGISIKIDAGETEKAAKKIKKAASDFSKFVATLPQASPDLPIDGSESAEDESDTRPPAQLFVGPGSTAAPEADVHVQTN